jgi:two-component system cell cycle response regulator
MKILIADTNSEYRATLVETCKQLGHNVVEALTMRDVLAICKKKCPDFCLIDEQLAGVTGIEIVKQIRQLGGVAVWNPIVLMGKQPTEQQLRDAIDGGADDFLAKPLPLLTLEFRLKSAARQENLKEEVFNVAHNLVLANRALENVITQDTMTGISDITKFHKDLQEEWVKVKETHLPLGMVIFDIDDFREYNNLYGSNKGDEVIKQLANHLQKQLPKECKTFARTAGAAFALLFPNTSSTKLTEYAENLRQAVASLHIEHKGSRCGTELSISLGASLTVEEHLKNPLDLMEAADFALYQAKHRGRNKVCFELAQPHEV